MWSTHLITTSTRLEVDIRQVHFLKTQRTIGIFLEAGIISNDPSTGMKQKERTASSSLQYASCTPARTCDLADDATVLEFVAVCDPLFMPNDLEDDMVVATVMVECQSAQECFTI